MVVSVELLEVIKTIHSSLFCVVVFLFLVFLPHLAILRTSDCILITSSRTQGTMWGAGVEPGLAE